MRKFVISILLIIGAVINANAATRPSPRGGTTPTAESATTAPATSARSAVRSARSATPAPTQARSAVSARSATTPTAAVKARAATTTQKVINSGTKVAAATANTAVSEVCQEKYYGCMDAFCMLDNTSGGRCICSNRNAELDEILSQIELLDQQSYQMATYGVEKIEMGNDANAVIAAANAAANEAMSNVTKGTQSSRRKSLDLSLWDTSISVEDDDAFDIFGETSSIDGKTGDALQRAAHELCVAQVPECASDMSMLKLLYAQKIKSDCNAYENSLKQQKNASQNKLATAERALRDAALEQLRSANKYDLGQCTIEFKKCMQTTGGCGNDFAGCASVAAMDNTNTNKSTSRKAKNYSIKGSATTIEIAASSYDTLLAKKPLCETVTKQCQSVADQVWGTFLKDVAPAIKSAELIAEDNARQNCIGNISSCFQRACRDNIDPNDPDGSYDMCLTRPETMLNVCKIPLNACGIDEKKATDSQIWDFVVARLASMRVDSCTREVKSCLQADVNCGSDYSQCIGLDMDSIIAMCPTDKLVGCQENGVKKSLAEISDLVMGIFLNIDNMMLNQCQQAVTTKMLEICGDTGTCAAFDDDNNIGTESLLSYKDSNGDYVIEGLISFGNVKIMDVTKEKVEGEDGVISIETKATDPENVKFGKYEVNIADYTEHLNDDNATVQRVVSSLQSTANKINQKIAILSQDNTIHMCVYGRDMSQIRRRSGGDSQRGDDVTQARYPNLLDSSILAIVNSGLERANKNYTEKYNALVGEALKSQDNEIKSVLCAAMASGSPVCTEYKALSNGNAICTKYEANNLDNVFATTDGSGIRNDTEGVYATRHIISGAKMSTLAQAQQSGHSDYVQTDGYGNMLGRVSMTAVYSPSTKTCSLTTESTMCKSAETVITTDTTTKCGSGGIRIGIGGNGCSGAGGGIGLNIGGGGKTTYTTQSYHGIACSEFAEPVTTTTTIKM